MLKSVYWLFDFGLEYWAKLRPALVRSTLVVYDRYLVDVLVDPHRYRFRGPRFLLGAPGKLVPQPDLVVLLDASVSTLRRLKQEVTPRETERRREDHRNLVANLPNGHVVTADGPVEEVTAKVEELVLAFMAQRTAARLGVRR